MGDLGSNIILICITLFIIIAVKISRNTVSEILDTFFSSKNAFLKINMELIWLILIYIPMIVLFIFSGPPILGFVINAENISFNMYITMSVIFGIIINCVFRVLANLKNDDVNSFIYCHAIFTAAGYVIYLYFWLNSESKENFAKKIWNSAGEMLEDGSFGSLILMFLLIVYCTELIIKYIPSYKKINLLNTE